MRVGKLMILVGLLASACSSQKPEGQVIAVVNGDEITRSELNSALKAIGVQPTTDDKALRNRALGELIARRLVVQAAKEDKLDKGPEYVNMITLAEQEILTNLYKQKIASGIRNPNGGEIDAYMAANPSRFAGRILLGVEQIRMPASARGEWMNDVHSLDALAARLSASNVKFQRANAAIDSATLSPEMLASLDRLPPGEPFAIPTGDALVVNVIKARQPAPLSGDQAYQLATLLLKQELAQKAMIKQLTMLRDAAKVEYQQGFGPEEKKK